MKEFIFLVKKGMMRRIIVCFIKYNEYLREKNNIKKFLKYYRRWKIREKRLKNLEKEGEEEKNVGEWVDVIVL